MITTCPKCGQAYEAGSEEQANEPDRTCLGCAPPEVKAATLSRLVSETLNKSTAQIGSTLRLTERDVVAEFVYQATQRATGSRRISRK